MDSKEFKLRSQELLENIKDFSEIVNKIKSNVKVLCKYAPHKTKLKRARNAIKRKEYILKKAEEDLNKAIDNEFIVDDKILIDV